MNPSEMNPLQNPLQNPSEMNRLQVAAELLGNRARKNQPLSSFTTYRLGGPAALLLEAESDDDLQLAKLAVVKTDIPTLVIGKGSNLLIADEGFAGLVIVLGVQFAEIAIEGDRVLAGAAVPLPVLARKTAAAALTGLEWAVGVPGSVGGALRMNAGGHGSQTAETLRRYSFVDLKGGPDGERESEALCHGYRSSAITSSQIITHAEFQLKSGIREKAEAEISEIVKWRRDHQPGGRNAGSVFTNPASSGDSAGRLIDASGLRGFRIGTAQVSEKHANFVQSEEGGTAQDVLAVIREVQRRVKEATGVELKPEVRLIGFSEEAI